MIQSMKTIKYLFLLLTLCLVAVSCEKEPVDNKIEGFWQLEFFTTKADNQNHPCTRMYYSLAREVAEIATKAYNANDSALKEEAFVARFSYADNRSKIVLKDFKWRKTTGDNGKDVDVATLRKYGIHSNPETFTVKIADGKNLVLESDYAVLTLKRF